MTTWKKDGRKVRNATLRAINSRMKKRVGESDLGRVAQGMPPLCAGAHENQASLYAQALGVSLQEAQERIARQEAILRDAGQPGAGTSPKQAAAWVEARL